MLFLWRHILESTLVGALLARLALSTPSGSRRHLVWLAVSLKFAVPTMLFAAMGSELASMWLPSEGSLLWLLAKSFDQILKAVSWNGENVLFAGSCTVALQAIWAAGVLISLGLWLRRSRLDSDPDGIDVRGILRPVINLPERFVTRLNALELRAVITHELAHVRRQDNLTSTLAHTATCLFWFHPLLHIAERRIRGECELACDDAVLSAGIAADIYLCALHKVCVPPQAPAPAGVSAIGKTDFQRRLARLRSPKLTSPLGPTFLLVFTFLALSATSFSLASGYCQTCVSTGAGAPANLERR